MTKTITDLINRRRDLFRATDELYEQGCDVAADSAEYIAMLEEITVVEHLIVATTATGTADIAAKWKFICDTNFVGQTPSDDTGDLRKLVAAILRLDVEAVGASIPELEHEGIAA